MTQQAIKKQFSVAFQQTSKTQVQRLASIDIVRGFAMIFMLLNHATWHVPGISFRANFGWDIHLPPLPFLNPYMWVGLVQGTPLFFIMAGFGIALFEHSRRKRNWTEAQITRFLLIRGGLLVAIDWLVLPWQLFPEPTHEPRAYFVLTSIGICLLFVAFMRLLPSRYLIVILISLTLIVQAVYKSVILPVDVNLVRTLFLYMSPLNPLNFGFPVLPWLSVILLGYVTMRYLNDHPEHFERVTMGVALAAWSVWLVISAFNDFGVLFPLHPLLMTKHPPSLAYLTFYIGVTYLMLYLLHRYRPIHQHFIFNRIALLGQTALIFYVLHFYVLDFISTLFQSVIELHPFWAVLCIAGLSLPALYFLCTRYRLIRKAHPDSFLKYL